MADNNGSPDCEGVFRFTVTTDGVAAHASMPRMGENALLKMGLYLAREGGYISEHDAVVGTAWMARGVFDVRDELQVTG